MVDIAREALRQYQELTDIIEDSTLIGGIYNMNYDDCTILSNDRWKQDAGGVPEHSYLLATSANWERRGEFDEDEAYAILLRAQGPAELENEQELREVRQKAMREMITGDEADSGPVVGTPEEFIDILTQNEIQYSGIKAKILGTFYQEDGELTFGSDIDTFYSSARYAVYKPEGEALSRIASFPVDPADDASRNRTFEPQRVTECGDRRSLGVPSLCKRQGFGGLGHVVNADYGQVGVDVGSDNLRCPPVTVAETHLNLVGAPHDVLVRDHMTVEVIHEP